MAKATAKAKDDLPGVVIAEENVEAGLPELRIVPTHELVNEEGRPLFEDPDNANIHDDGEIARLASSFSEHGILEAVTLNRLSKQVIGGHGRIEAAYKAQKPYLYVMVTDKDFVDQRAASLALNSGGYGHLDEQRLIEQLRSLQDRASLTGVDDPLQALEALTGFRPSVLSELLPDMTSPGGFAPTAPDEFPSFDENIPVDHLCPRCGYQWSAGQTVASEPNGSV